MRTICISRSILREKFHEGEKKKRRKDGGVRGNELCSKVDRLRSITSVPMKETGYCKIKSGYRGLVARPKIYTATISYPVFSRSKMSRDRAKCWRYFFFFFIVTQFDRKSKGFVYRMATFSFERNNVSGVNKIVVLYELKHRKEKCNNFFPPCIHLFDS